VQDQRFAAQNDTVLGLALRSVTVSPRFSPALQMVGAVGTALVLFVGATERSTAGGRAGCGGRHQLRYVIDVAAPVLGRRARRLARQAKKLQDLLGDYQDAVATRPLVHELGAAAAGIGHPTSTYYLVDALEQVRADRVLETLPGRLTKLYDDAGWLPKADTLRYDPRTPVTGIRSGD
jgi:hypothetical protein